MAAMEEYETVHYGNYIHATFTSSGKIQIFKRLERKNKTVDFSFRW